MSKQHKLELKKVDGDLVQFRAVTNPEGEPFKSTEYGLPLYLYAEDVQAAIDFLTGFDAAQEGTSAVMTHVGG